MAMQCIVIQAGSADPVLAYAVWELKWMLEAATSYQVGTSSHDDADWVLRLSTSTELPVAAFEIHTRKHGNAQIIDLVGHNASATLAAVYTLLERAGVCFDVTGPIFPATLELAHATAEPIRIVPAVVERGIRQHINFTMDISSYPLAEAQEYIRNLARLRYNHISFHSYPGQWYVSQSAAGEQLAGHFFYNIRHSVPEHPVVGPALRNRQVFCIPEIEAVFEQPEQRSRMAIEWLRAVIEEARKVGMQVQFSLEVSEEDAEEGARTCEKVLAEYPAINTLELITPENAHTPVQHLERYLAVFAALRARHTSTELPLLAIGIYETDPEYLQPGLGYLRQACPEDINWTFLPAHGARAVVDSMQALNLSAEDWQRTRLYSWVEFDGLMYNQQNSLRGAQQAIILAQQTLGESPLPGLDFNHWRTAENRAAIRYAALVCVDPSLTPQAFCGDYAHALGVGKKAAFVKAMLLLEETDVFSRDNLFNIGFCFLGCWTNPKGLSWTRNWSRANVVEVQQRLELVQLLLNESLSATRKAEGRRLLRFLINRSICTCLHLSAIHALLVLHPVCDDHAPEQTSKAGKQLVQKQCEIALAYAESYMKLHAELLPDRGTEGTLISYHEVIPAYIRYVQRYFLGDREELGARS